MPNSGDVLTLAPPNGEITLVRASAVAACEVGAYSPGGLVPAEDAANKATIAPVEMKFWQVGNEPILFFAPPTHLARTWRGRRVLTEEDMLKTDCPYPPDPDL
jgi:hypothetical protein